MAQKILGIDLGTSSIGMAVRDIDNGDNLKEQIEYFSVDIFKSGTGKDKTGEYSFAAERTKHRQSRRLNETRRRRLWATLELLIENNMCPMDKETLKKWSTYDKSSGLKREYPVNDEKFESWIRLDFDGDGKQDYSSPYQLRAELANTQLDFTEEINRFKLGRAIYHIAQRRGFKSSKGETIAEQEKEDNKAESEDITTSMKQSETKQCKELNEYIKQNNLHTVGEAFALLEKNGNRIRNSIYKAVRDQYEEEIKYIFNFQDQLNTVSELFKRLVSKKKGEGTIFYKKPLRSQKGLVGKCTMEPNKRRCPVCHPEFEKFRAWCFMNNIKYRDSYDGEWQTLPLSIKDKLFKTIFTSRVKSDFTFSDIRQFLAKELGLFVRLDGDGEKKTINYTDKTNVAGCPVTARLIKLLGEDWENFQKEGNTQRTSHSNKSDEMHKVTYNAMDIWHICFESDDPEDITEFAKKIGWEDDKQKELLRLWSTMSQGYAMLSLKAIKKINQMLYKGLKYPDAVMLAKVPEIAKLNDDEIEDLINAYLTEVKKDSDDEKTINAITNKLIADYKSMIIEERFAEHNYDYILQDSDFQDIENKSKEHFGEKTWSNIDIDTQKDIINKVAEKYQQFFNDEKRMFIKTPRLDDTLKKYLSEKYQDVDAKEWNKLYHPSQINLYQAQLNNGEPRLGSPNIGSIKNPVALRTLNVLRKKINAMLDKKLISVDDTRVVIETARDLNDSNMRWAINTYQRSKEEENNVIKSVLEDFYKGREINSKDVDMARYIIDQSEKQPYKSNGKNVGTYQLENDKHKYKLWLEQGCHCMYTGKVINLSNLFGETFDIEHTIPRSKSFDSSDKNLTVCDAHYNRYIKKNMLPTDCPNYEHDITIDGVTYTAIKPRLENWEKKVQRLKDNVDFWKNQSRKAQTKDRKDQCIRQKHLWNMELDYWSGKLSRFKMTEVKEGFKNSQLIDTGIITKYATLYLKSIFNNVDVQKGQVTADFRKMLGIQSIDEKKNRDKHSHHAIDATMLTIIPVAAKRQRMLEMFYKIEEAEMLHHDCQQIKQELQKEIDDCYIGKDVASIVDFIESSILINHHSKDQTLAKASKKIRIRGKEVKIKNSEGEMVNKWAKGDSIRGQLNKESFYGAIKYPKEDGSGIDRKPIIKDGMFEYGDNQDITMVIRNDIRSFSSLDEFKIIIDPTLRAYLYDVIEKRIKEENLTFKEAINKDIYLTDKYGHEIRKDKNGRPICPVRHVRCKVKTGRGFMTYQKCLQIRDQKYTSNKKCINVTDRSYKSKVYAQNDSNYLYLLYEGINKGKLVRKDRILNLYEISELMRGNRNTNIEHFIKNEPYFNTITDKKTELKLTAIIKVGYRVILWEKSPEEITGMSDDEISKRLYVVFKFNNTGSNHLYLKEHINAGTDSDKELVAAKLNCLIEHRDFEIDELGKVILKD